jgi:membrane-bound ClpP family serine protease
MVGTMGEVHDCIQEEEEEVVAVEVEGVIAPTEAEILDTAEYLDENRNFSTLITQMSTSLYTYSQSPLSHDTWPRHDN